MHVLRHESIDERAARISPGPNLNAGKKSGRVTLGLEFRPPAWRSPSPREWSDLIAEVARAVESALRCRADLAGVRVVAADTEPPAMSAGEPAPVPVYLDVPAPGLSERDLDELVGGTINRARDLRAAPGSLTRAQRPPLVDGEWPGISVTCDVARVPAVPERYLREERGRWRPEELEGSDVVRRRASRGGMTDERADALARRASAIIDGRADQ